MKRRNDPRLERSGHRWMGIDQCHNRRNAAAHFPRCRVTVKFTSCLGREYL